MSLNTLSYLIAFFGFLFWFIVAAYRKFFLGDNSGAETAAIIMLLHIVLAEQVAK